MAIELHSAELPSQSEWTEQLETQRRMYSGNVVNEPIDCSTRWLCAILRQTRLTGRSISPLLLSDLCVFFPYPWQPPVSR